MLVGPEITGIIFQGHMIHLTQTTHMFTNPITIIHSQTDTQRDTHTYSYLETQGQSQGFTHSDNAQIDSLSDMSSTFSSA